MRLLADAEPRERCRRGRPRHRRCRSAVRARSGRPRRSSASSSGSDCPSAARSSGGERGLECRAVTRPRQHVRSAPDACEILREDPVEPFHEAISRLCPVWALNRHHVSDRRSLACRSAPCRIWAPGARPARQTPAAAHRQSSESHSTRSAASARSGGRDGRRSPRSARPCHAGPLCRPKSPGSRRDRDVPRSGRASCRRWRRRSPPRAAPAR